MRYHVFLVYPGCSVNDIILNYLPLGISQPCDVIDVKETLYYFQLFFSIFLQGNRKKETKRNRETEKRTYKNFYTHTDRVKDRQKLRQTYLYITPCLALYKKLSDREKGGDKERMPESEREEGQVSFIGFTFLLRGER